MEDGNGFCGGVSKFSDVEPEQRGGWERFARDGDVERGGAGVRSDDHADEQQYGGGHRANNGNDRVGSDERDVHGEHEFGEHVDVFCNFSNLREFDTNRYAECAGRFEHHRDSAERLELVVSR